jgi:hypothetical protein
MTVQELRAGLERILKVAEFLVVVIPGRLDDQVVAMLKALLATPGSDAILELLLYLINRFQGQEITEFAVLAAVQEFHEQ